VSLYSHTDDCVSILTPAALVLATGSFERVVPFPGWTLPQVITPGAAQDLTKFQGVLPGQRVVVAGAGPFLMVVADQLTRVGAQVVAVIEATSRTAVLRFGSRLVGYPGRMREAAQYWMRLRGRRVPLWYGHAVVEARPAGNGLEIVVARIDRDWRPIGRERRMLGADSLCVGYGFVPAIELARLSGCRCVFDAALGAYIPQHDELMETSVPGVFVAGEAAGIGGVLLAELEGEIAGTAAAWRAGQLDRPRALDATATPRRHRARLGRFADALNRTYRVRHGLYDTVTDGTLVCRCEEVSRASVEGAVREGDGDVSAVKARTRCGMGMCQGRMCEQNLRPLVAHLAGRRPEEVGNFSVRPPIKPLRLAALHNDEA